MNSKKIANNILEFLFDPTVIPVERRMYFGPEERLDNRSLEKAKADSQQAYGKENKNSDFYPTRNRQQTQREAGNIMDRKTIIASLDVLSQNFDETDSIGEGLRAMAYTVSKMADEEFEARTAKKKVEFVTCPKCGNKKVMKQTGYCVKCGKKGIGKEDKKEDKDGKKKKKANEDFWTKAASEAVALALVEDVVGTCDDAKDEERDEKTAHGKGCECPDCKEEKEAKKKDEEEDVEAKKKEDDEKCMEPEAKKKDEEEEVEAKKKDEEEDEASASKKKEEEVEAKKKDEEEDVEAKKKDEEDEASASKKKEEEVEAKKKDEEEDVEAKKEEDAKKVNTDILGNVEGIEMDLGALSLDEVELTASDKEQLDKLFQ
jgi:ribosomal protein L37E